MAKNKYLNIKNFLCPLAACLCPTVHGFGLAKNLVQVFPYDVMTEQTFWAAQYMCIMH